MTESAPSSTVPDGLAPTLEEETGELRAEPAATGDGPNPTAEVAEPDQDDAPDGPTQTASSQQYQAGLEECSEDNVDSEAGGRSDKSTPSNIPYNDHILPLANLKETATSVMDMVENLGKMLETALTDPSPQHYLRSSMILSYSISTKLYIQLGIHMPEYLREHPPEPSEYFSKGSTDGSPERPPEQLSKQTDPLLRRGTAQREVDHLHNRFMSRSRKPRSRTNSIHVALSDTDDGADASENSVLSGPLSSSNELLLRIWKSRRLQVRHTSNSQFAKDAHYSGHQGSAFSVTHATVIYNDVDPDLDPSELVSSQYPRRRDDKARTDMYCGSVPEALHITHEPLATLLGNVFEVDLKRYGNEIKAPFGAVVFYWPQLQAKTKQLSDSATAAEQKLAEHPVLPDETYYAAWHTTRENLRQEVSSKLFYCSLMEGFLDLMTEFAGPSLETRQLVEDATLESIIFDELWQLFPVGETVLYHKDGREVACQVYNTSGGSRGTPAGTTADISDDILSPPEDVANHTKAEDSRPRDRGIPSYPGHLIQQLSSPIQSSVPSEESQASKSSDTFIPLIIDCFTIDFNGTYVGPCHISFQFDCYAGARLINALDVYPLRFHPDKAGLSSRLRERGRRVINATGHCIHDGLPLSGLDNIRGQIYVDNATGYRHIGWPKDRVEFGRLFEHRWPGLRKTRDAFSRERAMSNRAYQMRPHLKGTLLRFIKPGATSLSDDCYLLMSYVVLGYCFQQRRWHFFDIERIGSIDKSDEARTGAWKDLVIPSNFRSMLEALVDSHASGSSRSATRKKSPGLTSQIDLVRGKGNGLIILLHGPPGSGKTSTAETIAAYTKRPLYSITCGDIGTTAEDIEFNLQKHFDLANQWGCVLCLDEADVFLTKRDWHDLNRNSLVSVWLRTLEYYSGILFITTNRIGVIDEAFKSRIHICLRYPSLDLSATRLIWTKILDRIERENLCEPVKIEFDRNTVIRFAEKHYMRHEATRSTWNGRQIRNVVQTAISLGQYERLQRLRFEDMTEEDAERSGQPKHMRVELSSKNLKRIAATATDFEQYIVNVRGSDANSARNETVRDDYYDGTGERPQKNYDHLDMVRARGMQSLYLDPGPLSAEGSSGRSAVGWPGLDARGAACESGYGPVGKGHGKSKGKMGALMDDSDSSDS